MSELEQDHEMIKQSMESHTSAFEHHAKIMQELEAAGFKPNPVPQIGFEQATPPSAKTCMYFL